MTRMIDQLANALVAVGCPERCAYCGTNARSLAVLATEVYPLLDQPAPIVEFPRQPTGARLVESREERYGHPREQWTRAAALFTAILNGKLREPIEAHEVGLLMVGWKLSRLCSSPDDQDSLHDLAGYAAALELLAGRTPSV